VDEASATVASALSAPLIPVPRSGGGRHRQSATAAAPTLSLSRQLVVFFTIGAVSTAAYAGLYVLLRRDFHPIQANMIALLTSMAANTWANRHYTFGRRGRDGAVREFAASGGMLAIGLVVSSLSLSAEHALLARPSVPAELATLFISGALATLARFLLLRSWIFARRST
jgi:putative flippase GtrA